MASSPLPGTMSGESIALAQEPPVTPQPSKYPPYPPYVMTPAPPSVAETIIAGRDLRVHKPLTRHPARPPPRPARPRYPKVTDVKMSLRAMRAHARCMRRQGGVLTDRLERLAKPRRRAVIYLWREYAELLPPEAIERFRRMLNADEPFKPDQAYEYFIACRKTRKKANANICGNLKKDRKPSLSDKRFIWARNATVAFARGIQQRLARPGHYALADGMLRLSNVILSEICGYMKMRTPCRASRKSKAKFMMEISDKIAVWIDEILSESDDRMLMMDFDEDEDILNPHKWTGGGGDDFTDDFLNMMGGSRLLKEPSSASVKFKGGMQEAFNILTDSMNKKGGAPLISYGKFRQTYAEGADELKKTRDFTATEFNTDLSGQLVKDLTATAEPYTPAKIAPFMKEMVDICSNFLAQNAEWNKDKGPAFKLMVQEMKKKPNDELYHKGNTGVTYGQAAVKLDQARGLRTDRHDPTLAQNIQTKLSDLVDDKTPGDLKTDMTETLDLTSKYLSQDGSNDVERGLAFDILIKRLESNGAHDFTPQFPPVKSCHNAAYVLKSAPGLTGITPDPATAPVFVKALHNAVDDVCPGNLKQEMEEVIQRCADYLSAYVRDREKCLGIIVAALKRTPSKELVKSGSYTMDYGTAAQEIETAPAIIPYSPVKHIADEISGKISKETETDTPLNLKTSMKGAVADVSDHLSQSVAARSGAAGARYPLSLVSAVVGSEGDKPLFKEKSYVETYSEAGQELKYAKMQTDPKSERLTSEIGTEMQRTVSKKLSPTVSAALGGTMSDASKHLANVGVDKAAALEYLLKVMREEGDAPLAVLQGYEQTFRDAVRRIKNADNLSNDTVDKGAYETVHGKLKALIEKKPNNATEKAMPEVIDEVSRFLSSPFPETDAKKRQVLADLMAQKGSETLVQEGTYNMTYTEGGKNLKDAPVGVTTSHDKEKQQIMEDKINAVIPNKKLKDVLQGDGLAAIETQLKKEGNKEFLHVGKFEKTYGETGDILHNAKFGGENPNPIIKDEVKGKLERLDKTGASDMANKQMPAAIEKASNYIADVATKESGTTDTKAAGGSGVRVSGAGSGVIAPKASAATSGAGPVAKAASGTGSGAGRVGVKSVGASPARQTSSVEEAARLASAKAEEGPGGRKKRTGGDTDADAADMQSSRDILHKQLRAKGNETFYKQPHSELSHKSASDWLKNPSMNVPQAVKDAADTTRLAKKFERKLDALVSRVTPEHLVDSMQDVIIESSRSLAEYFVAENYKALVKDGLISEMQKHGNDKLIEKNGLPETYFFAAQRLKKVGGHVPPAPLDVESRTISHLYKRLEDAIRCRSIPRKLVGTMKEHVRNTAHYLSDIVTTPDATIEAYVALLTEMDAHGSDLLIEGEIPKSYQDSASYLKMLTSSEDQINLPSAALERATENNLREIMKNVPAIGYTKADLYGVIHVQTKLLVSYVMLQVQNTSLLKLVVERMSAAPERLLLRHGEIRKSNMDGVNILSGKNTDQLTVTGADPVVERKLQIKMDALMEGAVPNNKKDIMDDVISVATRYLAVHLLKPRVIQVCKCMKSVFVQCELWCEEILRRMSRPCCSCSRQLAVSALADLAPGETLVSRPGTSRAHAPSVDITIKPCMRSIAGGPCPAAEPSVGCKPPTASYLLYSTEYNRQRKYVVSPTRLRRSPLFGSTVQGSSFVSYSSLDGRTSSTYLDSVARSRSVSPDIIHRNTYSIASLTRNKLIPKDTLSLTLSYNESTNHWAAPTSMYMEADPQVAVQYSEQETKARERSRRQGYETYAPVVSTDQMVDWHAMMVSLTWNVQAWRKWIQDTIDRALLYHHSSHSLLSEKADAPWNTFRRKIATEALQWRQYNIFSRQLISRLSLRYKDRRIVSPTRATVKNEDYMDCQREMMEIINMFNRWTHWLSVIVRETDSLRPSSSMATLAHDMRWSYLKNKVEECAEDWKHYNNHLKLHWEQKFTALIPEWFTSWNQSEPVWVVSACGAVPSGAVAAGVADGETTWVARSTHRCRVLPAALRPTQHCCVLYADGAPHHYTKYQVLCNATVKWIPWCAGKISARVVQVAPRVHAGRVQYRGTHLVGAVPAPAYRCHVVIHGRAFAFNNYELLVFAEEA